MEEVCKKYCFEFASNILLFFAENELYFMNLVTGKFVL